MISEAMTSRIPAMRTRSLAPLLLAGTLGLAGLAACGGDDGDDDASGGSVPADVGLRVGAVEGIEWDAEEYTAPAGDVTVLLDNTSSLPHNLYFVREDGTELPESLDTSPQAQDTDTVTLEAGTYTIICKVPGHSKMKATLTVS